MSTTVCPRSSRCSCSWRRRSTASSCRSTCSSSSSSGRSADPDVLPHRGLGRAAQEVRRDQVLHVHLPREPPAPRGDLRILLLLEPAHVRHASDHRDDADPRGNDRGSDVRRPLDRVRHETADLAVAYVAPAGGSVILAGILLKLGGYGLIRFNVQMIPQAAVDMYWLLALAGVISILYGAVVCLAQDDLKRLVAFSSVSHMGFVTLGIAAGVYGFTVSGRGAVLGFSGAIFQMFAHGLVSAALFMVAGSLGHKIGTRNISELGGIAKRAPRMATFIMISFMASLGLPGLVGFVAEFAVFIGVYAAFGLLVFVPILTVVVTAAYYIWAMQRAIFGPLNPKWETMPDLHRFEVVPLAVLVASFAVFGIAPVLFLSFLSNWAQGILGGL